MPGYGSSYWADGLPAARRPRYPVLRGEHSADVVVIGAGLTGAIAAAVLARGGLDVILLDGDRVASGATAGSLGLIVPQPDAAFRPVEAAVGLRRARTAWKEARLSALEYAAALKKLKIRCGLDAAPIVINAAGEDEAASLRKEQAARKQAGIDAPWLAASVAGPMIGTDTAGTIRLREGAAYDPFRAATEFVRVAAKAGARVFEKSAVRRTRFTRTTADVILADATIRARGIFVATGAPGALFSPLRRHVRVTDGFVVVTDELSPAMKRETGRRDTILTETGTEPHWLRWMPDGHAMFAGLASKPVPPRLAERALVQRTAQLMYELSLRYPIISGLPARWSWSTPVVSTADGLPWIGAHRNYPFHFFAFAFGWHGDALAWFAARAALRHFKGEAKSTDDCYGFSRL